MPDAQSKRKKHGKRDTWPVTAFFLTFVLAMLFSLMSETTLLGVPVPVAIFVLFLIVCIGILADMIGVAVTVQDERAYTAMASKKIRGARKAIMLVQNAGRVSNVCNDVVGDICGIVSGAMGAAITARLIIGASNTLTLVCSVLVSALTAAFTVGGKAMGKRVALTHSQTIVFNTAKALSVFDRQ